MALSGPEPDPLVVAVAAENDGILCLEGRGRVRVPKPSDGTDASLWLEKISRTGLGGGGTATLPDVSFTGKELDNRIDANPPGVPLMRKLRIATATDELGRVVEVTYGQPDPCGPTNFPEGNADTNSLDCYPAQRVNGSSAAAFGWFYKYLVTSTTVRDTAGGSSPQTTRYTYRGGAAWHLEDAGPDPDAPRAHDDYRGYAQVDTSSMSDPGFRGETTSRALSLTRTRYFRGMDGDPLSNGTAKNVQITDSQGGSVADTPWLNGRVREEQQLQVDSAGNPTFELGGSISDYASARTIRAGTAADADKDSHLVVPTRKTARTTVIAEGTEARTTRTTRIDTTYDGFGQPLTTTNTGASAADVRCTSNAYARDAATVTDGMLSYPYRVRSYVAITATGPNAPGTAVTTSATFDSYGRTLTATDGRGSVSRTAYTPATGRPQSETATNALGQTSTVTMDADRGIPIQSRDANGKVTISGLDALGRLVSVRTPDQATADPPAKTFAYTLDAARLKPARITSRRLQSGTTYLTSYQFMDSLARPRQQQSTSPASTTGSPATLLVDTRYDDRGQKTAQTSPMMSAGTAGAALIAVSPTLTDETRTTYDTAGRATQASLYNAGTLKWSTTTAYFGDHARTTPPVGGVAKTTWTDVWDRTVRSEDGAGANLVATTYGYDGADRVVATTDPAGHTSSTVYDLLGRITSTTDPDAGTSTTGYDNNDNPVRATDAKGQVVTTDYDALDRPTAIWAGASGTGTKLHGMTYDSASVTNGIGRAATQSTYDDGKTYSQSVTSYDPVGRPVAARWDFPAGLGFRLIPATFTMKYTYDTAGHMTSTQYPDNLPGAPAETVSTGYDALGYAKTLTATSTGLLGNTDTTQLISNTGFAADGKLISRSYANPLHPITRRYNYETGTQRLSNISTLIGNPITSDQDVKQNDDYTWDPSGNLSRITDRTTANPLTPNPVNTCYGYDGLDRLTHAWTTRVDGCADGSSTLTHDGPAGMNESWTYSPDGNITSARSLIDTKNYEYTDAQHPHAVTKAGLNTYKYDANGAMTSKVAALVPNSLTWNAEHQLASSVSGILINRNVYDATGSRLVRFNADGSATLYLAGEEISITKGITTGTRYYSIEDTVVGVRTPLGLTWQLNDIQGSAQISVASGLSLTSRTYYDPYGKIRSGLDAGSPPTDHGFIGTVKDPATSLNAVGARYYDSDLARFVSVDPMISQESAQAANAYGYGNNNPIAFTDPTGLFGFSSITHAVSSAANWVGDHKQAIASAVVATVAAVAVTAAVCATGVGCAALGVAGVIALTAGSGAAGAAASYGFDVATGAEKNPSLKGFLTDVGLGAATGVLTLGLGKGLGALLRKPAASLASSSSSWLRSGGRALQKLDFTTGGGKSGGGKTPAKPAEPETPTGPTGPTGPTQDASASAGGNGSTAAGVSSSPSDDIPFVKARSGYKPTVGRGGAPGSRGGKAMTPVGKDEVLQRNAASQSDGIARCANPSCDLRLTVAQQSKKGVSPRSDEAAVDHYTAQANGGSGDPSNAQGLCRVCNGDKSDGAPQWPLRIFLGDG